MPAPRRRSGGYPNRQCCLQSSSKGYGANLWQNPYPFAQQGAVYLLVTMFEKVLGIKSVLFGFGLDSDAIHSPNEKYGVFNYFKGIETLPYFYQYFTEDSKG
jgi:acetylornithine deacetylase/succinyl-diaminopimelate desuccinylase-like protein